jgi:hypothetical protein
MSINANQVGSTMMGATSGMFVSLATTIITLAVKSESFVNHTFNTLNHLVSASENITRAADKRSESYADGIINNGVLAEQERTLKYKLRLHNIMKQTEAVQAQTGYEPPIGETNADISGVV